MNCLSSSGIKRMCWDARRLTRDTVPACTVGDAILKIFITVQVRTRVSIVHQRVLLHITQVGTQQWVLLWWSFQTSSLHRFICSLTPHFVFYYDVKPHSITISQPEKDPVSGYLWVGFRQLLKDFVIRWLAVLRCPFSVIIIGVVNHQGTWIPTQRQNNPVKSLHKTSWPLII